jgi:hypothetical protein
MLIPGRKAGGVQLLANIHPAPAANAAGGSIASWIWLGVALAIVVILGYVLSSRP